MIDFRILEKGGSSGNEADFDRRWWLAKTSDVHDVVFKVIDMLNKNDTARYDQYEHSNRLYGNVNLYGINGLRLSRYSSTTKKTSDRLSYNVCQSCVDTLVSKMAKNKPKPLFLTSGGDFMLQRKAKKLDKFIDGIFYENEAHHLGINIFKDSLINGDGLAHVYTYNNRVKFERVLANELFTDFMESLYGNPRQLHRVKIVDRYVLMDQFRQHKQIIKDCNPVTDDSQWTGEKFSISDHLIVSESWHLPSGPNATDGRRSININNGNLLDKEWKKPYFPFAKYSWSPKPTGFFSQGLIEQIQDIQTEITKILWIIQKSIHLAGSFKVFIERGSRIVGEKINNEIGSLVEYTGVPPQYYVPNVVPVEYYQHLINLKSSAYEQSGISQLSASSLKPEGLNSGKALREANNIESERFMLAGQNYEKFFVDLGKLGINEAVDIYEKGDNKSYSVQVPNKRFIKSIDWKDIKLDESDFIMQAFPVSSLPNEPAYRLQTVSEYMQAGIFSRRTGRKLLNFPDIEQVEDLEGAEEEYLNMILEKIVEEGDFTGPDIYDNLNLARELALEYMAQGKLNGLEADKIQLLTDFLEQIDAIEEKIQQDLKKKALQDQAEQNQLTQSAQQAQALTGGGQMSSVAQMQQPMTEPATV